MLELTVDVGENAGWTRRGVRPSSGAETQGELVALGQTHAPARADVAVAVGTCLAWSLRERMERGIYAASVWRDPCDVAELPERQESADNEAA